MPAPKISAPDLANISNAIHDNARLRAGLWIIFALLWFYLVLLMHDFGARQEDNLLELNRKIARIEELAAHNEWLDRASAAQTTLAQMEKRLWTEKSNGLAQAAFQDWLAQSVKTIGLEHSNISVTTQDPLGQAGANPMESTPERRFIKFVARLEFDFTPNKLYAFLGAISGHSKAVAVDGLHIRLLPSPRAEATLSAYAIASPAGATSSIQTPSGK